MPRLRQIAVNTEPLRNPDFRRLLLGQGVAFIGFQVTAVAVPVQMYAITHSSLWVGLLGVAALVPLLAFGLYGGAIADVVDRRRLYLVASCALWAVTGAFLLQAILRANSAWILLALMALQSVGFAVSSPVRGAIVPRLLDPSLVPAGNTLSFTMSNVGTVAGPLVAGAVLARFGYAAAYAVDAGLFTFGMYAALRLPALPPLGGGRRVGLRSVAAGLRFIATRPVLALSFAFDIIANAFAMPRALFPQVAAERFGGPSAAGWLYASIAIGAVAGGLASGWIGRIRHQGVALVSAVVAWGLLVAAAGLARSLWLAVLLLAGAGAADLVSAVYRQTILQVNAPDEMRGRMQGVFIVVVAGGPRLGDLRAGGTAAAVGVTASWVGGGIACVVLVLALAVAAPRSSGTSRPQSLADRPRRGEGGERHAAPRQKAAGPGGGWQGAPGVPVGRPGPAEPNGCAAWRRRGATPRWSTAPGAGSRDRGRGRTPGAGYAAAMTDLTDFARLVAGDHGLCVVSTLRPDNSIQASVVNAGVLAHPLTGRSVAAFVARGGTRKLANMRARPRATFVIRAGWQWVAAEGAVELAGPDDPLAGIGAERLRVLLREIFTAAGGTHEDWDTYDKVMADEHRTAVLLTPDRVYSNSV